MKYRTKKTAALFMSAILGLGILTGCAGGSDSGKTQESAAEGKNNAQQEAASPEHYDVNFLFCWNGGSVMLPDDQDHNAILDKIEEKTGVRLHMEAIATNETEKLNTLFSSGTVPDLVSAAYWWSGAGEALAIRKGIEESLVYDLTDLLPDYPNVANLLEEGLAEGYKEFDLNLPEFNGRSYLIPTETPSSNPADLETLTYGVYCRKDILEALEIDPASITSEDALYDLIVKISEGGFKDAVGNPAIPAGAWHSGWRYSDLVAGFDTGYHLSNYREDENGNVIHYAFSEEMKNKILWMRRLVSEGLFDVECFTQNSTTAQEKFAVGRIGVYGGGAQATELFNTLYKTNPEMEYTLVGPLKNQAGDICTTVSQGGASGSPVLFLAGGMEEKKARAILGMLDYINSDEGRLLVKYGIEGETWNMVDGYPTYTDEVQAAMKEDASALANLGLGFYEKVVGAKTYNSKYPVPENQKTDVDKYLDAIKAKLPLYITNKISVGLLERSYEGMNDYYDRASTIDLGQIEQRACFAASDEEAMEIWDEALQQLTDAGIMEMCESIQKSMEAYENPDALSY